MRTRSRKASSLDAVQNINDWSYKIPGILSWGCLIGFLLLTAFRPWIALEVGRVVAWYLVLRIIFVIIFYLIGMAQMRRLQGKLKRQPDRSADETLNRIHHVVLIAAYKEPYAVMQRTLNALAAQENAVQRLTIVLAMEERDPESKNRAESLAKEFENQFAHIIISIHPANVPGELACKGANLTYAAHRARHDLLEKWGYSLDNLTITSSDADSIFPPGYFNELAERFASNPRRYQMFWEAPLVFDTNIWNTPASIRLTTFFTNSVQVSELANPFNLPMPLSTYSLSFRLADETGYWDPAVISDDWHMMLRAFFAQRGNVRLDPIMLPLKGDAVTGSSLANAWKNSYTQKLRHAWGCEDIGYILQQQRRDTGTPAYKVAGIMLKVMQDHLVFSTASIIMLLATLLSIALVGEPVLTLPTQTTVPWLVNGLNALSGILMWVMWGMERLRASATDKKWKIKTIAAELANWALLPISAFLLTCVPVLHAQTKMMFGSPLEFVRTPKRITSS